jgi:2-C-methyl-D-erythritol 2,4-cyclodiphosphate synthase
MRNNCLGHGFDLHRLESGRKLVIGGVPFDHDRGCVGHSDGDVLYHAATDAILGALGQDDIGQLFPDNDPKWRDADSSIFVAEAARRMTAAGYAIGNLDATVILTRPKVSTYKSDIRRNLSNLLSCSPSQVNVKGKTHEQVGALGRDEAVACHVVVLLIRST